MSDIEKLKEDVKTLMQEREELYALQKQLVATQEASHQRQLAQDAERQAKGWAIDRAIETVKVTNGDYTADDVIKLADKFSGYILQEAV